VGHSSCTVAWLAATLPGWRGLRRAGTSTSCGSTAVIFCDKQGQENNPQRRKLELAYALRPQTTQDGRKWSYDGSILQRRSGLTEVTAAAAAKPAAATT